MGEVHVVDHPLVQHKLTLLRNRSTGPQDFRLLLEELSLLLAYEASRDLPLREVPVETPLAPARGRLLAGPKPAVIPILRAGLGMAGGFVRLLPGAKVGHIGVYRRHDTLEPVDYYCKLPADLGPREIFLLDPMLATGGSAAAALDFLGEQGGRRVRLVTVVAAPDGIRRVHKRHPQVPIFTAAVDEGLDENAYIVPGLGDAGDRLFGTG